MVYFGNLRYNYINISSLHNYYSTTKFIKQKRVRFLTKFTMETMKSKQLVYLVAVLVLAVFAIASVSAADFGSIYSVKVNGIQADSGTVNVSAIAGQTLPVEIRFDASTGMNVTSNVRVKAWISGARDYSISSQRFVVVPGSVYNWLVSVQMPSDIDPTENLFLVVRVESSNDGTADEKTISLAGQRESYKVEILDVNMDSKVSAGSNLALDVVLKNRGFEEAQDTFVSASISSLGIDARAYFSDLAPVDQSSPDKNDAAERRLLLKVPAGTPAGIYNVEISAYNADSVTTMTKKVAVVGAGEDSTIVSAVHSQTVAPGTDATYSLTLVNSGSNIAVYELVIDASSGLSVDVSDAIVAVPAGSSKTVKVNANAQNAGTYTFTVNVHSSDGQLVKAESYTLKAEGSSTTTKIGGNATVLLTVVLAIIFIVLLVVLIVLLTRKPKKEEFGESYY